MQKSSIISTIIIKPLHGLEYLKFGNLWHYRELLYFLVWRDLKVRYKQTLIGAAWAIVQPFVTMIVFSIFFGRIAKIPSEGIPYPIFSYAALLPWTLFSQGTIQASNSLVSSASLITKVYFPRLVIPISAVLSPLLDFAIAFVVLIGMMIYYGVYPTVMVFWFPVFLLLTLVTTFGISIWFSALNVKYRDVRYAIPFLVQIWLFATPVIYPSTILQGKWRVFLGLNPMTAVIEGFRWSLLGVGKIGGRMIWASIAVAVVLFFTGIFYFQKTERSFADVV